MITRIKKIAKDLFGFDAVMKKRWLKSNTYSGTQDEWYKEFIPDQPFVGLLYDIAHEHQYYIKACHELKINYKVIDIRSSNWIELILESECAVFLAWPTIYKPVQKQFWDERLTILRKVLGKKVFPTLDLLWLYESKRRTRDWLKCNNFSHPQTEVFFTEEDANKFLDNTNYPIVLKTDQGAVSSGVYIIRSKKESKKWVKKAFNRGIRLKNRGINDRHKDYIIFQEYLPDCKEWRLIRVGESYFCRLKLKRGDFHSGSGEIIWAKPPEILLNLTREISERFEVPNINVDFFETDKGEFLVNELHALWGGKVLKDEELEGRYIYDPKANQWRYEKGDFFGHRCAELRLEWIRDNWL